MCDGRVTVCPTRNHHPCNRSSRTWLTRFLFGQLVCQLIITNCPSCTCCGVWFGIPRFFYRETVAYEKNNIRAVATAFLIDTLGLSNQNPGPQQSLVRLRRMPDVECVWERSRNLGPVTASPAACLVSSLGTIAPHHQDIGFRTTDVIRGVLSSPCLFPEGHE